MMLAEREPLLPAAQQETRTKFLLCLQAMHLLFEFSTVDELVEYLEKGLDELVAAGYPRKLSRVILVFRTPAALHAVADRMHPVGSLQALQAPECWPIAERRMPEIIEHARTIEPDWIADVLKG